MTLTMLDQFCGAGGSSQAGGDVPGIEVRVAANHWQLAIDTHQTNFPNVMHDRADLSVVHPRRYPRTDLLWTSPECTNHSRAKGRRSAVDAQPDLFGDMLPDEAAERSRATMWDALRFAEYHRYRGIILENVVEVRDWVMWPAWVMGLRNLGYEFEVVYLNSMFAQATGLPAPQSRDRLYVVAWRSGDRRPDLEYWTRPVATCSSCGTTERAVQAWKRGDRRFGRYREQYVWRCAQRTCRAQVFPGVLPAATAIDWSIKMERIGARRRALSPRTRNRIAAGLRRYARPVHLEAAGNTYEHGSYIRAWPIDEPSRTLHGSPSKGIACPALLVPAGGTWNDEAQPVTSPMRTRTSRDSEALACPPAMIMRNNSANEDASWPCTPVSEPIRTLTTKGHQSLIRWDHLVYAYDSERLRSIREPLPTQTSVDGDALIGPEIDVDDVTFRMLEPDEIRAGMAFAPGYVVLGNRRERIRQLGQAVTPPAARDLISALAESITGEQIRRVE